MLNTIVGLSLVVVDSTVRLVASSIFMPILLAQLNKFGEIEFPSSMEKRFHARMTQVASRLELLILL